MEGADGVYSDWEGREESRWFYEVRRRRGIEGQDRRSERVSMLLLQ